jgi:iron(III) transport system substrate-binding protein
MIRWLWILAPALLVLVPVLLRPAAERPSGRTVTVITPHGEAARLEFASAFAAWSRERTGAAIAIDWRTPGGSGDIERLLRARFAGALREAGIDPAAAVDATHDGATTAAGAARAAFLASHLGAGIDILWGGGEFTHRRLAGAGFLVDGGVQQRHPEWFDPAIMPQEVAGEVIWDRAGRYYGSCLAVFGIVSHTGRLAAAGIDAPPSSWADLADPRLRDRIVIADPTRSAAVLTGLERLIQTEMQRTPDDLEAGWRAGWSVILRMTANARRITDGASPAVREVVRGDGAAAMAIDFHARSEIEWAAAEDRAGGRSGTRAVFLAAAAGTSVSADPIAILRGAPDRAGAELLVDFILSPEGQRLWNFRPGTPGGPQRWALRRMPVRRDSYGEAERVHMSDPTVDPYALAEGFRYRPAWTAPHRPVLEKLVRSALIDPHRELVAAWSAVLAAGGPERVPAAWAELSAAPLGHAETAALAKAWRGRPALAIAGERRAMTEAAVERYRRARALAEAGR